MRDANDHRWQITRFTSDDAAALAQALAIRREVFVQEQGVPAELEYEHETEAHHYLARWNDQPVGTARWRKTSAGLKLERFAVRAAFRRHGAGSRLLRAILADIRPIGQTIYLHAQLAAAPFYEQRGFIRNGSEFSEAGIAHVKMVLAPVKTGTDPAE